MGSKTITKRRKRNTPQRSQRAREEYRSLPTSVSLKDFNRHIKPHLSMGTRGQRTKISTFRIFNHILRVLHTGMQWERLQPRGCRWGAVYHQHLRWSKDGSYERLFEASLRWLKENNHLDLRVLHGDGSNTIAKKGALGSGTLVTSTNGVKRSST